MKKHETFFAIHKRNICIFIFSDAFAFYLNGTICQNNHHRVAQMLNSTKVNVFFCNSCPQTLMRTQYVLVYKPYTVCVFHALKVGQWQKMGKEWELGT